MKAYVTFLCIPVAVLAGLWIARLTAAPITPVALPTVASLKVPVRPEAVPPVARRAPIPVDLRPLVPIHAPPVIAGRSAELFVLSAILVDGERRVAQIGSDLYQVGDSLGEYTVRRIDPLRVLLQGPAGTRVSLEIARGY